MNQKKLAGMRKFKFGVVSVLLTAVVIAAIVIVNVIFSSLAYNKNWYLDLTKNKIYELSDAGRELLDGIDADITVHFCAPFDTLEGSSMANMVFNLVKEISAEYENITYDYIDINKNPTAVTKYKSTANTTIVDSSVIVESGKEFRVLNLSNMFMYEDETRSKPWAFNGELKLITAMAQCTQIDTPIAYFTTTHGETFSNGMMQLFLDAGFEIQPIDLTKDEINEAAKVIVISSPVYDFEGISELTQEENPRLKSLMISLTGSEALWCLWTPKRKSFQSLRNSSPNGV
ncbi:MAG: Gldg family protein [Clostridia bacterium]|nr:Gldg family protein [Clostridia bacterium]